MNLFFRRLQSPDIRVKAHFIERELLMMPWNVTRNFVLAS
jgi:hypothetical protein